MTNTANDEYPYVTDLLKGRTPDANYINNLRIAKRALHVNFAGKCQLKCGYCVSNMHKPNVQKRSSLIDQIGMGAYLKQVQPIIDRYAPMKVTLTGPGEPAMVPGFTELAHAVFHGGENVVSIQTNMLPIKQLLAFINAYTEEQRRNIYIAGSYHVGAFADKAQPEKWRGPVRENFQAVVKTGVNVGVIVPLAPAALVDSKLENDLQAMKDAAAGGFKLQLVELGHIYKGKRYPGSYTAAERRRIQVLLDAVGTVRVMPKQAETLKYMTPRLHLKGMPCYVRREVNIGLFGGLFHCNGQPPNKEQLGHLGRGIELEGLYSDKPLRCPFDTCSCRSAAIARCLRPARIDIEEYYAAYYRALGDKKTSAEILAQWKEGKGEKKARGGQEKGAGPYPYVTGLLRNREPNKKSAAGLRTNRRHTLSLHYATTCSLRCQYCISNMHVPSVQQRVPIIDTLGVKRYVELLWPYVERWGPLTVNLLGPGEPTASPHFVELAKAFTSDGTHKLILFSNMDRAESFFTFIEGCSDKARRCVQVCPAYHFGAFLDKKHPERWRERARNNIVRLMTEGIKTNTVVLPLTPETLAPKNRAVLLGDIARIQEAAGRRDVVQLRRLSHLYKGKRYPGAYTQQERDWIVELMETTGGSRKYSPKNVDLLKYANTQLYLKGMPCYIPMLGIQVGLFGGMWHCFSHPFDETHRGHIADGYDADTLLASDPVPCAFDVCTCRSGVNGCLTPAGITFNEYCAEYYRVKGDVEAYNAISKSFTD
ncbi:MAG: hypothetical protein ACYSWU_07825 [Planctomycetota bacterium]|jgi:MoaA/NifB/PqqE/SkfB family radical SAM enzyme